MSWRQESTGVDRIVPQAADEDGIGTILLPRDSSVVYSQIVYTGDIVLDSDSPRVIDLGACVDSFNAYRVRVKGGLAKVILVSDLSVTPMILPAEPKAEGRSDNTKFTAISVQRAPGIEVTVNVFLGKRS